MATQSQMAYSETRQHMFGLRMLMWIVFTCIHAFMATVFLNAGYLNISVAFGMFSGVGVVVLGVLGGLYQVSRR